MNFWSRLKGTRFARIVLVYLAASWGAFKLLKEVGETFHFPQAIPQIAFVFLVLGLIVVLAAAWAHGGHEIKQIAGEGAPARVLRLAREPRFLKASGVLFAVFGAGGIYAVAHDERPPLERLLADGVVPRLAVAEFAAGDPALDGEPQELAWLLAGDLDGVAGLRTLDPGDFAARREGVDGENGGLVTLADSLGAHFVIRGRARTDAGRLALTADVLTAPDGDKLGTARAEGSRDEPLALADSLAAGVLRVLGAGRETGRLGAHRYGTRDREALVAFLRAESAHRRLDVENAVDAYLEAIDEDPDFALAHFRLGLASYWGTERDVGDPFARAVRLVDRMPESRRALARAMIAVDWGSLVGVEDLQRLVGSRRDDPEALYLLGYAAWTLGHQALLPLAMVDSTLAASTALDPRFAPAWLVRVRAAFQVRPDSAWAWGLIDSLALAAPGSPEVDRGRLAHALAFGDPATRRAARGRLASLTVDELWKLAPYLAHPGAGEEEEAALQELAGRAADVAVPLAYSRLRRGLVASALEALDSPDVGDAYRAEFVYGARLAGYPIPQDVVAAALRPSWEPGSPIEDFYRGAFAAEERRWDDLSATIDRLHEEAQRLQEQEDPVGSRLYASAARALDAYGYWNSGSAEASVRALEKERASATAWGPAGNSINGTIRLWIAHAWRDLGRPREASRYYATFWVEPMIALHAARAYDAAGDEASAREAYGLVVESWVVPDPELTPLLEEARGAVGDGKIGGAPREAATCSSCPSPSSRSSRRARRPTRRRRRDPAAPRSAPGT